MFPIILGVLFSLTSTKLFGQSSQTNLQTLNPAQSNSEAGVDKADQVITNRMMRAQTGSLSPWSVATAWNYQAGSLERPFDAERPNVAQAGDVAALQALNANLAVTYRFTSLSRLGLGIGLNTIAPFHQSLNSSDEKIQNQFDNNQGRMDLNNPNITYTYITKVGGIQSVLSATVMKWTTGVQTDLGYDNRLTLIANTMYDFGGSPYSIGIYGIFEENSFNKNDELLASAQQLRTVGILPQAEWVISDRFVLRTIARPYWYDNYRNFNPNEYRTRIFTQSAGLGISVTRDIFLYPNIQFQPENLQSGITNVGLNANINLF
jgi:hypothetical protein